jgi:hypothetical protein
MCQVFTKPLDRGAFVCYTGFRNAGKPHFFVYSNTFYDKKMGEEEKMWQPPQPNDSVEKDEIGKPLAPTEEAPQPQSEPEIPLVMPEPEEPEEWIDGEPPAPHE